MPEEITRASALRVPWFMDPTLTRGPVRMKQISQVPGTADGDTDRRTARGTRATSLGYRARSTARQRYQLAVVRWGRHRSPMAASSFGLGISDRP